MASVTKLPTTLTEKAELRMRIDAEVAVLVAESEALGSNGDEAVCFLGVLGRSVAALTIAMRDLYQVVAELNDEISGEEPSG